MSLEPEDLLSLAQRLNAQARLLTRSTDAGLREATLRNAISRAYYAVFWCGRRYFATAQPPQSIPRYSAHSELQSLFDHYAGQSMKTIAVELRWLRALRNRADYDLIVPQLEDQVARALRLANRLLGDIASLPDDPTQAS